MTAATEKTIKNTYADYLTWPNDERWEIIDGRAYNMTPAPSTRHQNIVVALTRLLGNTLAGRPCNLFVAPTDVVLSEQDVVQPDILIVCDEKKITEAHIQGAPDLVIEVLSPATALKDKREKKALYERSGIREYILVDPAELYAEAFRLDGKEYGKSSIYGSQEVLPLESLEGVEIPLREVFVVEGPIS